MPDDLRYESSSPNLDRPRSSAALAAALAVFVLLLGAGAATYFYMRRGEPAPAPAAAVPAPAATTAPPATDEPRVALPPLEASDDFLRQQLAGIGPQTWREWLASDGLARRFAAALAAVAEGKSPRRALERPFISGKFAVVASAGGARVDPSSYGRYDIIASTVEAIDVDRAAAAYRLLHPLLDEAWTEVGLPGDSLDDAARRALDHLLATPEAPADAAVELRDGLYRWTDPELESSTAAQKHLLRMGPTNAAKVKATLRRLRATL